MWSHTCLRYADTKLNCTGRVCWLAISCDNVLAKPWALFRGKMQRCYKYPPTLLSEHKVMCTAHGPFFVRLRYIHTYMHTYIHTYIHTCTILHGKFKKTATGYVLCPRKYISNYPSDATIAIPIKKPWYNYNIHTCIHAYIQYIHTYIHTYEFTYIYVMEPMYWSQTHLHLLTPIYMCWVSFVLSLCALFPYSFSYSK